MLQKNLRGIKWMLVFVGAIFLISSLAYGKSNAPKTKPPVTSKAATVKRQPSPWMKEAQRQNQVKAQQRQKTIKDLRGAVKKTDRDMHKNRAKTAIKINKGVQQTLIGGH
jgi:hypothetical protein